MMFCYEVLILEVNCGRIPSEGCKPPLVEWVWECFKRGELLNAVDAWLRARGELAYEEVERVIQLGLICAYPDPNARPTMRQIVKLFEEETEVDESEGEGMEIYLLNKMKTKEIWSMYPQIFSDGSGSHPTIEEIGRDCLLPFHSLGLILL